MSHAQQHLEWIDAQHARMVQLVRTWAAINTGSRNLSGLRQLHGMLREAFAPLGGEARALDLSPQQVVDAGGTVVELPLGQALWIRKRPEAPRQVFLGIHMDTVFGEDHPFQQLVQMDANTLRGPGVADAKGGLAVMLVALEALERTEGADRIGWEVLINPDEEIGSPGSTPLFYEAARRTHLGLVYEPSLPDGTLIGQRKGSGNFSLLVRGRSAHAGRDFHSGRNAMCAAAEAVVALNGLNESSSGLTLNVAKIDGGGPANVVPDLAIVRFNIRSETLEDQQRAQARLDEVVEQLNGRDGYSAMLHGGFYCPPKPLTAPARKLLEHVADCGRSLGLKLTWKPSGGVCDGNRLAAAGLPVVDTLGPRGGNIHSAEEYLLLDSLTERAKLSALLLIRLAAGELDWP